MKEENIVRHYKNEFAYMKRRTGIQGKRVQGLSLLAFLVFLLLGGDLRAQNSADVITYINLYKSLAMNEMQRSGIPASIILAQGIHETEAGTSELVRQSNNHFGIKCKDSWTGSVVYHDDDSKQECFRSYESPADSYKDHSDFLKNSPRYAFLFRLNPENYEGWAWGLRKAGYATNVKYSQILIKLIKDYNLQQYTLIAMGKLRPTDEVLAGGSTPAGANNPGSGVLSSGAAGPGGGGKDAGGSGSGAAGTGGTGIVGSGTGSNGENGSQVGGGREGGGAGGGSGAGGEGGGAYGGKGGADIQAVSYPQGEFEINRTRVVFAKSGVSLLSLADRYGVTLSRLLEFNDLEQEDVLVKDQLLFLQRKRKSGSIEFHTVLEGESLYDICQSEGVRYENILEMNHLQKGSQPAAGERVYLQGHAPSRPLLAGGKETQELIIHKN